MKSLPAIYRDLTALVVMILGAALLVQWFKLALLANVAAYCFGGRLFTDSYFMTGGALDQPSLHKGLFLFCLSFGVAAAATCLARWIGDGPARLGRVCFRALIVPLLLVPLCILSVTFAHLIRYIGTMGITPRRIIVLLVILADYAAWGAVVRLSWKFREVKAQQNL